MKECAISVHAGHGRLCVVEVHKPLRRGHTLEDGVRRVVEMTANRKDPLIAVGVRDEQCDQARMCLRTIADAVR